MAYIWVAIEKLGLLLIRLLLIIILSRFLTPEDFGLYAMVAFIIMISNIIIDSGLSGALIQKQNVTNEYFDTTFSFNIVIAFVLSLAVYFLSPLIAIYFGHKEIENIVKVLALTIFIKSLATTQIAILTKELKFKVQVVIFLAAAIVSSIIGCILAMKGFGYWSLIYIQLIESLLISIFFWYSSEYKPKIKFSKHHFLELYSFGGRLMLSSIIISVYSGLINVIIGKKFGADVTGYYFQAQRINELYNNTLTLIVDKTIFPILSKIEQVEVVYDKAKNIIQKMCIISFVPPTIIYINSDYIVSLLLGGQWAFSADLLKILILSSYGMIIESYLRCIMKSRGEGRVILRLELIKKIVGIVILCISAIFSIEAILYTLIGLSIFNALINSIATAKILNVKFINIFKLPLKALFLYLLTLVCIVFIPFDDEIIKLVCSSLIFIIPAATLHFLSMNKKVPK